MPQYPHFPDLTAADHVLKHFGPAFVVGPMISGKVSVASCFNGDRRRADFTLAELKSKVETANLLPRGTSMEATYDVFFGRRPAAAAPAKTAPTRELYILRGVPGSGKSGVATALADSKSLTTLICSADHFFTGADGVYRFDASLLKNAHNACWNKATAAMGGAGGVAPVDRVILDNCNVDPEHFREYEEIAQYYGYRVIHLVIERRHNGRNVHGVDAEQVSERAARLSRTLRL